MTDRDDLAALVRSKNTLSGSYPSELARNAQHIADAILAAGWRAPLVDQDRESCLECMGTGACFACSP